MTLDIDKTKPLGAYTDEELAVLPHTFAHKKVGCEKPGPRCAGRCIATCEDLPNLRLTTIRLWGRATILEEEVRRLRIVVDRAILLVAHVAPAQTIFLEDARAAIARAKGETK